MVLAGPYGCVGRSWTTYRKKYFLAAYLKVFIRTHCARLHPVLSWDILFFYILFGASEACSTFSIFCPQQEYKQLISVIAASLVSVIATSLVYWNERVYVESIDTPCKAHAFAAHFGECTLQKATFFGVTYANHEGRSGCGKQESAAGQRMSAYCVATCLLDGGLIGWKDQSN